MLPLFRSRVRLYIYLPMEYNPDPAHLERPRQPIPLREHFRTMTDIENYLGERFEGMSYEFLVRRRPVHGRWRDTAAAEREPTEDELMIVHLDALFSRKDLAWFTRMKDTQWRERFQQQAMYAVYHRIVQL